MLQEDDTPKANCRKKALKVVVTVLFIVIVVGVVVIWTMHEGRSRKHLGSQYFDFISKKRRLDVYNQNDDVVLNGYLKVSSFDLEKVRDCNIADPNYCFIFEDESVFKLYPYSLEGTNVNCMNVVWENLVTHFHIPEDCYDIDYGLWYGLPNFKGSFWPLDLLSVDIKPMPFQPFQEKVLGQILEGYWLSTEGIAIIAHQDLPYKISFNSGNNSRLCLTLDIMKLSKVEKFPDINYTLCQGPDIKQTYVATRNLFFPRSSVINYSDHNLSKILWTYQDTYDNKPFGEFLHGLNIEHLPVNMVEFDSQWEEHRGDLKYTLSVQNDLLRFLEGKYAKVKLMLPITLSCSYLSKNFIPGASNGLFARDPESLGIEMVNFSNSYCALWDASKPAMREMFKNELDDLQNRNSALPKMYPQAFEFQSVTESFSVLLSNNSTSLRVLNEQFIDMLLDTEKDILLQTAYKVQTKPVFVEVPTVITLRNGKKCLDYIIPGALTAGLHGYPYILTVPPHDSKIDKDLFIRWLQIAITFPGLKITNAKVNLQSDVTKVIRNLIEVRESQIIPEISKYVDEVSQGVPLIRPLWWINPMDYKTLQISDQYLIGSDIMITPILCNGDRKRDVYIPEGSWRYNSTGEVYKGKQWLKNFYIPFDVIPVFVASQQETATVTEY